VLELAQGVPDRTVTYAYREHDPVTVRQRIQYKSTVRIFAIPQTPLFEFVLAGCAFKHLSFFSRNGAAGEIRRVNSDIRRVNSGRLIPDKQLSLVLIWFPSLPASLRAFFWASVQ
jgi:hypothetical protein